MGMKVRGKWAALYIPEKKWIVIQSTRSWKEFIIILLHEYVHHLTNLLMPIKCWEKFSMSWDQLWGVLQGFPLRSVILYYSNSN